MNSWNFGRIIISYTKMIVNKISVPFVNMCLMHTCSFQYNKHETSPKSGSLSTMLFARMMRSRVCLPINEANILTLSNSYGAYLKTKRFKTHGSKCQLHYQASSTSTVKVIDGWISQKSYRSQILFYKILAMGWWSTETDRTMLYQVF